LEKRPEESAAEELNLSPEQRNAWIQFEQSVFRAMDLELLQNPTLWPHYPFLELHDPGSSDGIYYQGLMVLDEESGGLRHRTTVFDELLTSMQGNGGQHTVDDLLQETSCVIYDTLDDILKDGWQVA